MTSDRTTRQIERLLDEAEQAITQRDWKLVLEIARDILALDPDSADGRSFLSAAERRLAGAGSAGGTAAPTQETVSDPGPAQPVAPAPAPSSFANGRYTVKRFLGEGGKKRVFLAHDTTLARDVAFALIKTDGLDLEGRERITREAQAMGKLGTHPHVVSVFDMGSEGDSPYLVTELMQGGDIEGLLEQAPEHRLAIPDAVSLAVQVCRGLEFAHSHGLVHRDLKPGNVWLTADGTAKIGDFGLAVSLDRSRLTRAGMMVGTVSYMPPEQAMGGEVSPRSDLYSLGAMLYEMVTGRPPFVGEESVAIITQHLNVPPVSPTWHRPDCPPGLEALILRLLEKDAAKRPASAAEVRPMLENLAVQGPTSKVQGPGGGDGGGDLGAGSLDPVLRGDNPLYRRTFVGREQELRQLQATFDGAVSGNGALVMVVGEPGIGKTALCEQLATYVTVRGGKALVGHCYEEGSLTLPYLPFVEAVRSHVLAQEAARLRKELGSAATEVARIVSEIREKVQVEPRPSGDAEDDRWRLFQAVTSFLRNAGAVQPLLIVLEDLHWADRGTLDLLVHLGRNLQGARLLVVGTYRDLEVDRAHPLSSTLAELRRSGDFSRIPLRGLTVDEVARMMNQLRGQEVPWSRAEAIHRQTEGNPLFIQEVLRYLVEEGLVVREGDRWVRADGGPAEAGIPEGLRDVIGKRLSRLGPESNRILAVAAVIGRDFRVDVLQRVAGVTEEELSSALEEAAAAAVIESRSGPVAGLAFRFAHAFFRQTLYEEIFAMRRVRLHQQVARALEDVHGRRLEEHAGELAEHFSQSTETEDAEKALSYSQMAATRALAVYAYGEAVRHLERAVQVQELLDPDDRPARCDLLLRLGEALILAGEPLRVAEETAREALRLAEAGGDHQRAARACILALDGLRRYGSVASTETPAWSEWAERADRYAAPDSIERVYADLALGETGAFRARGGWLESWELTSGALALARQLGDAEAMFTVSYRTLFPTWAPRHHPALLALAEEAMTWPRRGVSARAIAGTLYYAGFLFLCWGRRERAEAVWREQAELAARTSDPSVVLSSMATEMYLALVDGRLDAVLEQADRLVARGEELGAGARARLLGQDGPSPVRALTLQGRYAEVISRVEKADVRGSPARVSEQARALALAGRPELAGEVFREVQAWVTAAPGEASSISLASILEIAILLGEMEFARELVPLLRPLAGMAGSAFTFTCPARVLGDASALLSDAPAARAYYAQALEVCGSIRFRPETALTKLSLAELLLEHYPKEQAEALAHLDFAIAEFREMKMQPALERALKHKGLLHA